MQEILENERAKDIAKKERERLRVQDKIRKEQVEKMREQINSDAAAGEVRLFFAWLFEWLAGLLVVLSLRVLYTTHQQDSSFCRSHSLSPANPDTHAHTHTHRLLVVANVSNSC